MLTFVRARLGGLPLIVGGLAGAAVVAIHPEALTDPRMAPTHLVLFFAVLAVLLGLPTLAYRQPSILTSAGCIALAGGLVFDDLLHSVLYFTIVPIFSSDPTTRAWLADDSWVATALMNGPFGFIQGVAPVLALLGLVLLSAATLRGRILPRWPAVMHVIAAVALPAGIALPMPAPIGPALLYLGLAAYGGVLVLSQASTVQRPVARGSAAASAQPAWSAD